MLFLYFTGYLNIYKRLTMSTQHSHIKNTTKKIKLDEDDESISNIVEYKN